MMGGTGDPDNNERSQLKCCESEVSISTVWL